LYLDYQRFLQTPLTIDKPLTFTIQPGDTLRRVARRLKDQGVIKRPVYLGRLGRETGLAQQLKTGEYELTTGLRPQSMLELFASGKVKQYAFTIIEGWTFQQLCEHLAQVDSIHHMVKDWPAELIMSSIGAGELHPEGQFLPDTYHYPRGTTDIDFLKRAHQALVDTLQEEWEQRADGLPLKTPYEALTLASIIEKETGVAAERPEIAGVFIRRLQRGMRLQTDPTVIYGLGADFDGDIRYKDLRKDTPYNTYIHSGLPPTPIAMAGRDAIHAALHPASGTTLYFVSKGDGSHYFSSTLEEHSRAVRKYQLNK